jgi:hypothetical protein
MLRLAQIRVVTDVPTVDTTIRTYTLSYDAAPNGP